MTRYAVCVERKVYSVESLRPARVRRDVIALITFMVCGNVAAVVLLARGFPALGLGTFFGLVVMLAVLGTGRCTVDVGADGVLLRWLRGRRFIPIAQIESAEMHVEPARGGEMYWVRLRVHGEDPCEIGVGSDDEDKARADALAERVRKAVATNRTANAEGTTALLDRRARTVTQWIDDLRAVGRGTAVTLRTEAITSERLWRIVQSAAARPVDRAAAAIALSAATKQDRARIRVAADAVVEPKLRVVLERAASQEDSAALEQALAELEKE